MLLGSFILKPDFFENKCYFNVFMQLLEQSKCQLEKCFVIKNYTQINNEYRKLDLKKRFRNKKVFEKNFARAKIAYDSYNISEYKNFGLLLLIKSNNKINLKEFYNVLKNIKDHLREHIKNIRNFVYIYLKDENCKTVLIKANEKEFEKLKAKHGQKLKLAFINGIHLEDYYLFKKKFCYRTFKKLGIISKFNSINPLDIKLLFNNFNSIIDLHIHSNNSDGKYSYNEIYKECRLLNIKYASICDHDEINIKNSKNPNFINGIEFNVIVNEKKQHVLCYNFNINSKSFFKIIKIQRQNRINQLNYRLNQLKEHYNFIFSNEDIKNIIENNHFSREYIAELLVKYRYCSSFDEALNMYINKLKHGRFLIDLKKLAKLIHKTQGLIILAHPLGNYKKRISFENFKQSSSFFIKYIDGIETFYSIYNNEEIKELFNFAQENNLLITCGSDYHGTRPINEKLGKICAEDLTFENIFNFVIAKKQIEDNLFRR